MTRERGQQNNSCKNRPVEGDVDSRIQVAGWWKTKAAAQKRAEDGEEWSVAYVPSGEKRFK